MGAPLNPSKELNKQTIRRFVCQSAAVKYVLWPVSQLVTVLKWRHFLKLKWTFELFIFSKSNELFELFKVNGLMNISNFTLFKVEQTYEHFEFYTFQSRVDLWAFRILHFPKSNELFWKICLASFTGLGTNI